MKGFIVGVVIGLVIIPAAVYLYFSLGLAPVATDSPPMPFEEYLANMALDARIEREKPQRPPPIDPTEENLTAGAKLFSQHCDGCHGKIDKPPSVFAKSLFPRPPWLLNPDRKDEATPGEIYWVVTNGIRLSAMPAFKEMLSDEQRWQMSQMLANSHKLPSSAEALLK
jgi:mono/diheme cytochrome c family protein